MPGPNPKPIKLEPLAMEPWHSTFKSSLGISNSNQGREPLGKTYKDLAEQKTRRDSLKGRGSP